MTRQARLDTPGALHHVIGRGIERTKIFGKGEDRADFLGRIEDLARSGAFSVFAWSLMDNHFHLLLRTENRPLAKSMRKLLTGYAVNFNRRHKRYGHLFQNRYKSILCEEDAYLLELTRYIHLNPVRAGVVNSVRELAEYPWSGHGAIVGSDNREWQNAAGILAHFGKMKRRAIRAYEKFVEEGVPIGRRPELTGGGLIRSLGGWSAVLSARRRGERSASDQRILGSADFVEEVWRGADTRSLETLRGRGKVISLEELLAKICGEKNVEVEEIRQGNRRSGVVEIRKKFCQVAVKELEYSGATVARFLGVATSTVNRYAAVSKSKKERDPS